MKRIPEAERMDRAQAADAYAEADFSEVNAQFVEAVVASFGDLNPQRILDLGCGPADIPIALANATSCVKIVAVDAAAEMLKWAAARVRSNVWTGGVVLVHGDAKRLPFAARSFDAVISNSILHHVVDPIRFWREVARTVRNGGQVFMRDLMRPDAVDAVRALVDKHARDESEALRGEFFRSLCAAYTVDEIREQLREAALPTLAVRAVSDRHLDVVGRVD